MCIPNPCQNAGKCFPAENHLGYHCICIEGKRGLQCERKYMMTLFRSMGGGGGGGAMYSSYCISSR